MLSTVPMCESRKINFILILVVACAIIKIVGVDCGEGPPVPIPNTEVKLICAHNTWLETAWEDR